MFICEKCGKEHNGSFGSGRFCSRACANSRVFSEESKQKKSLANKGMLACSNEHETIYVHDINEIPAGYVLGNFHNSKCKSLKEFEFNKNYVNPNSRKILNEKKEKALVEIDLHNKCILERYEKLLSNLAENKEFHLDNEFIFAKYYSVTMPEHPRSHEGHVFSHILLGEELLGKPLTKDEIVHHKNSDKLDNRFDNIYIFDNKGSHARFHYSSLYWLDITEQNTLTCKKINLNEFIK